MRSPVRFPRTVALFIAVLSMASPLIAVSPAASAAGCQAWTGAQIRFVPDPETRVIDTAKLVAFKQFRFDDPEPFGIRRRKDRRLAHGQCDRHY